MTLQRLLIIGGMAALFCAGYTVGRTNAVEELRASPASSAQVVGRVFELRTYTAADGKLNDLLAMFRNDAVRILDKHGMTSIGYWVPQDSTLRHNTLIYMLAHPSRERAEQGLREFQADPEWQRVAEEANRNGSLVASVQRRYLDPTDFSQMR